MRKLQESFKGRASQSTFNFTLIEREEHKALYKKENEITGNIYYEAIIVRISKEANIGGNIIPESEKYPSDNEFGTYGICTSCLDRATEYYNQINYTPNPIN